MNEEMKCFLVVIGFFILIAFIFGWYGDREAKEQYEQGYKAACKDFYKGKLKYDLIENLDGTREWKKIK